MTQASPRVPRGPPSAPSCSGGPENSELRIVGVMLLILIACGAFIIVALGCRKKERARLTDNQDHQAKHALSHGPTG